MLEDDKCKNNLHMWFFSNLLHRFASDQSSGHSPVPEVLFSMLAAQRMMELIWSDASACLDITWIRKNALSVFQV